MARTDEVPYAGRELELFALATNWKRYVKAEIGKYLAGDVLEIGAGIGGTTLAIHDGSVRRWTCLEPDANLAKRLRIAVREAWGFSGRCKRKPRVLRPRCDRGIIARACGQAFFRLRAVPGRFRAHPR